jgi:hypothetical protein
MKKKCRGNNFGAKQQQWKKKAEEDLAAVTMFCETCTNSSSLKILQHIGLKTLVLQMIYKFEFSW